jgi:hypothetical protein
MFPFAAIIAKCKTAPALLLVVIMLKVDCKSVSGRVGDGCGNAWRGGGSGLAEGYSGGAGSGAVAGFGLGGGEFAGLDGI